MILWFTFYQMELDFTNFWGGGAVSLLAVVMCVNLMVLAQMNIFDVVGTALPLLSIAVYFLVFWFMNLWFYKSDTLFGTFSFTMNDLSMWLGLLLVAGSVFFTERTFELWSYILTLFESSNRLLKDIEVPLLGNEPHVIGVNPINFSDHTSSQGRPTGNSDLIKPFGSISSNRDVGRRHSGYAFNEENNAHSHLAE